MASASFAKTAETLLGKADIRLNGDRPWDIRIKDERCIRRWLAEGSLGFGETYMDGMWESDRLDETVARMLRADLGSHIRSVQMFWDALRAHIWNLQSKGEKSQEVNDEHYDLGNDIFERMLDPLMVYTCAYWKDAKNLAEAQKSKLELICRKIGLKAGQRVLDIGCGFGGFCTYAAETYGAKVVGITLSSQHKAYAEHVCKGLPVEIRLQDYRDIDEPFDHIVSIEMIEAVGVKNLREYFAVASRCLRDGGLFLLQVIGSKRSENRGDPWVDKYIFRNGMLPSLAQIGKATESLFVLEDCHNFGVHYEKTLLAWFANFDARWHEIREKYGDRFYRMWKYYLLSFAGAFRVRHCQLWQMVLAKGGVHGGYIRSVV